MPDVVTLSEDLNDENNHGQSLEEIENPVTTNSIKSPENNDLPLEVSKHKL